MRDNQAPSLHIVTRTPLSVPAPVVMTTSDLSPCQRRSHVDKLFINEITMFSRLQAAKQQRTAITHKPTRQCQMLLP